MAPVIKVDAQTMLNAGGLPKITPGSPVDGVLMAVSAEDAVVSHALASVFVGQGPEVQTATTDGVMRFQNQDGQNQQLLRQVADEAKAQGATYTV